MLAAHRNGGRTDVASFARAWDEYTGARRRGALPGGRSHPRALLEASLDVDTSLDRVSIAALAEQIRAERRQRAGHMSDPAPTACPSPTRREPIRIRRHTPTSDLLDAPPNANQPETQLSREAA